jgi:hypothetical protein
MIAAPEIIFNITDQTCPNRIIVYIFKAIKDVAILIYNFAPKSSLPNISKIVIFFSEFETER